MFTAVNLITPRGAERHRLTERGCLQAAERGRNRGLSRDREWRGKAGGYAIQGFGGVFVVKLIGSYTSVVGLPLNETVNLLAGEGFPVLEPWSARG